MPASTWAETLQEWMAAKRFATVPPAAKRLKTPHQTVYAWINHGTLPSKRDAADLAKRMGNPAVPALIEAQRKRRRTRARSAGGAA